ncbi:MAG: hypothetical protein U0572_09275 [Phycisphaerales bacterium]
MARSALAGTTAVSIIAALCASFGFAGTSSVDVTPKVSGQGSPTVGSITVDPNGIQQGRATFITAKFTLDPAYAYLDVWYDFRWVNVETGYTVDGDPVDADGDGNPDDPVLGELPAIDPQPVAAGGDDNKPFYWTDDEFAGHHVEGQSSSWEDNRSDSAGRNVTISFTTYLVAVSITDPSISANTMCVLGSFSWTSTTGTGTPSSVETVTGTNGDPGAADAATINTALGNAGGGGFPGGWSADADCTLNACPYVIDCVYSTVPGATFSASTWTLDGAPIGATFNDGVTPPVGVPMYDGTYLPADPNDWHWSVTVPCDSASVEVSVWVVNYVPGTSITVDVVCSPLYAFEPEMLMVDVGNDSYQLSSGRTVLFEGAWSAYPANLPPELAFVPSGASRANFVACDPTGSCAADFNDDGKVDAADLGILLGAWGSVGATDLNCDLDTDAADLGILLGSWGACDCGTQALTQSASSIVEPLAGILCYDDITLYSLANQWARSFDLATIPETAGHPFVVTCVDVGVDRNTGSNIVGTVRLYVDVDGGSPQAPGVDLVEVAAKSVLVPAGYPGGVLQARFGGAIVQPNATLVASLEFPRHYDGLVVMGANNDGQTGPTYLRAPDCDVDTFETLASLGFPNSHWVMTVHGEILGGPPHNRGLVSLQFLPVAPPGAYLISAHWFVENGGAAPVDLSTDVAFAVNGSPIGTVHQFAATSGASGTCLGSSPPCDGSYCGAWDFGILTLDGHCGLSVASIVGLNFCTCGCAVLTTAPEPVPLQAGDVVTVSLVASPGSAAEAIVGDDTLTVTFSGPAGCPGVEPCGIPHSTPGCSDVQCCSLVCAQVPPCCELSWDTQCVQIATLLCP